MLEHRKNSILEEAKKKTNQELTTNVDLTEGALLEIADELAATQAEMKLTQAAVLEVAEMLDEAAAKGE